jgi:hypothetical protein
MGLVGETRRSHLATGTLNRDFNRDRSRPRCVRISSTPGPSCRRGLRVLAGLSRLFLWEIDAMTHSRD